MVMANGGRVCMAFGGVRRRFAAAAAACILAFGLGLRPHETAAAPTAPVIVARAAPSTAGLPMFPTEAAAQAHCPKDEVVWLNTRSGIWHEKGMRWYGRTREGAYVCKTEAAKAGMRDTRNGQ